MNRAAKQRADIATWWREKCAAESKRVDELAKSMFPDDDMGQYLVKNAASVASELESVQELRAKKRKEYINGAARREASQASRLGFVLFEIDCGPRCIPGLDIFPDECALAKRQGFEDWMNDPGLVVKRLESTRGGCDWLAGQFAWIREKLEGGFWRWSTRDTFVVVRLLGKKPLDAMSDREVAEVLLASLAFDDDRRNAFVQLSETLGFKETTEFVEQISTRITPRLDFRNAEDGRRAMKAIAERAIARLKAKAEEHRERAAKEDTSEACGREFDASKEGKPLLQRERECARSLRRSLNLVREHGQFAKNLAAECGREGNSGSKRQQKSKRSGNGQRSETG
jgi:hypothetical protein